MSNEQDSWLLPAFEIWLRQDFCQPRTEAVLEHLLRYPHLLRLFPLIDPAGLIASPARPTVARAISSVKCLTKMTIADEIEGIEDFQRFDIGDSTQHSSGISISDFILHFENSSRSSRCLGCFGMELYHPRLGATDSLFQVQYNLPLKIRADCWFDTSSYGRPQMDCGLTMPGYYSGPHQDSQVLPFFVAHVSGAKIWFCWPLNDHNRKVACGMFLSSLGSICHGDIVEAIDNLQGMSLRLLQKSEECFILEPGELHAVISLLRACHVVCGVAGPNYFNQAMSNLDVRLHNWELVWNASALDQVRSPVNISELRGQAVRISLRKVW